MFNKILPEGMVNEEGECRVAGRLGVALPVRLVAMCLALAWLSSSNPLQNLRPASISING